jgi:hypothetical protein
MGHSSNSHIKTNKDIFPCSKFFLYRVEMLLVLKYSSLYGKIGIKVTKVIVLTHSI